MPVFKEKPEVAETPVNQAELQKVQAQVQERRIHLGSLEDTIPRPIWNNLDAMLKAVEKTANEGDIPAAGAKMKEFDRAFKQQVVVAEKRMHFKSYESLIYPKSYARISKLLDDAAKAADEGRFDDSDSSLRGFGNQVKRWSNILEIEQKTDELYKKGKITGEDHQFIKDTAKQAKEKLDNEQYRETEILTKQLQKRWKPYEKVWEESQKL